MRQVFDYIVSTYKGKNSRNSTLYLASFDPQIGTTRSFLKGAQEFAMLSDFIGKYNPKSILSKDVLDVLGRLPRCMLTDQPSPSTISEIISARKKLETAIELAIPAVVRTRGPRHAARLLEFPLLIDQAIAL